MTFLIDTQILIWFQLNDKQLKPLVYNFLTDRNNRVLVSSISLFEIAIKQKTGKLFNFSASVDDVVFVLNQDGFEILPIKTVHITVYSQVPLLPEHRDPFDRLLIATALFEGIPIISADEKFRLYSDYIQLIEA